MCHTRLTARSDPSLNFGEEEVGFGSLPIRPRYTAGPQGSAKCGAAAYTVRPSLGSRPMWYTPAPAKNGPATDHFLRSAEWKRNPPFFVPTATTTLSFLIVPAMSTTRYAGQDMHDAPRLQCHRGKRRHHEVFVQEQVHIRRSSASLVDNPIPESRERGIDRLHHAGEGREAHAVWHRCGRGGPARGQGERLRSRHRAPPDRGKRDPGVPEGPLEARGHPDAPWSTERRCRFRGPGTARRAGAPSPRGEL